MNNLYGWFDGTNHAPTYDPPHDAPCPYCGEALRVNNVRTHSHVSENDFVNKDKGHARCYFFRTHITCDNAASEHERNLIFQGVIRRIEKEQSNEKA